jgi:predicted nucleic acid-binding protein
MADVALAADVVIAFLDPADAQHDRAVEALRPHLAAGSRLLLAASVYAEILVRPMQRGSDAAVDAFVDGIAARIVAVDRDIARRAAELRARHRSLRLPDALSLATALAASAELLTLDLGLRRIAGREQPAA